jgi:UMF1 family MFS transporter
VSEKASKLEIFSWCLYDFANSSFTTVIVTAFYVLYFKEVVLRGYPSGKGDFFWGLSIAMSMAFVALSSPVLGAVADYSGAKKKFLRFYSLQCIVFTGLLFFVKEGDILTGMLFFILANIGFEGGIVFYNAFLPEIATAENIGRISGYGWSLGYFGGLTALVMVLPLVKGGFTPENLLKCRLSFVVIALCFLVFSFPTFIFLKERAIPKILTDGKSYIHVGFSKLRDTFREIKRYQQLLRFLLAYFLFNDAIATTISFSAAYAQDTLNFSVEENIILIIVINITAAIGAFLFGFIVDRIGAKKTISITLLIWITVVISAYLSDTKFGFWIIANIAGTAIGASQSASRSLLGSFSPKNRSAEFFGFEAVCGRFSAIFGPVVFGIVSSWTGSQRTAILSIGFFFVTGFLLLQRVNEQEGIRAAQLAEQG